LGLSTVGVAVAVIPVAALWLANALWLGRRQERLAARELPAAGSPAAEAVRAEPAG
jgi:hypothetical protein